MNTTQDILDDNKKLRSIPEVKEDNYGNSMRDVSSSEKPPKIKGKLINDTILEERESPINDRSRDHD